MTIASGIELPDSVVVEFCRKYSVQELALFGSAARDEMRPDSDIDLLVVFKPEARVGLFEHAAAQLELAELCGRKVDLVTKSSLKKRVREEVLPEARLLYAE